MTSSTPSQVPGAVTGSLAVPNNKSFKVADAVGYASTVFAGKQAQMVEVCTYVTDRGFVPKELINNEVSWFYGNLGIDDVYFQQESIETIAQHIMSLYAAKIHALHQNEKSLEINLERETEEAYRLESFRSFGTVSSSLSSMLRCYFVRKCVFAKPEPTSAEENNIHLVGDKHFLEKATENTLEIYQNVMKQVLVRSGPVIEMFDVPNSREKRLVIGFRHRTTRHSLLPFPICITTMICSLPANMSSSSPTACQSSVSFPNRLGSEYTALSSIADINNSTHVEVLSKIKKRLRTDTFTRDYILDIIKMYP
ncbi:hypothetical protein BASA81_008619 [Batrachochytrium salamandrivorans]|nr:hypothetical protein BASA81_008619 [Batrachochytrium salamandrivorans]